MAQSFSALQGTNVRFWAGGHYCWIVHSKNEAEVGVAGNFYLSEVVKTSYELDITNSTYGYEAWSLTLQQEWREREDV